TGLSGLPSHRGRPCRTCNVLGPDAETDDACGNAAQRGKLRKEPYHQGWGRVGGRTQCRGDDAVLDGELQGLRHARRKGTASLAPFEVPLCNVARADV